MARDRCFDPVEIGLVAELDEELARDFGESLPVDRRELSLPAGLLATAEGVRLMRRDVGRHRLHAGINIDRRGAAGGVELGRLPDHFRLPLRHKIFEADGQAVIAGEPSLVSRESRSDVRIAYAGHRRIEPRDREHDRIFDRCRVAEIRMEPMPTIHAAQVVRFGNNHITRVAIDEVVHRVSLGQFLGIDGLEVEVATDDFARHEAANEAASIGVGSLAELERTGRGGKKSSVVLPFRQSLDNLLQQVGAALGKGVGEHGGGCGKCP